MPAFVKRQTEHPYVTGSSDGAMSKPNTSVHLAQSQCLVELTTVIFMHIYLTNNYTSKEVHDGRRKPTGKHMVSDIKN